LTTTRLYPMIRVSGKQPDKTKGGKMDYSKLNKYMVVAKLVRVIMEPVLVDDDVTLPDGTFIAAGTNMEDLEPAVLDALELYYWSHDPETNCDLG